MFDLISGRSSRPFRERQAAPTLLSVIGHGAAVLVLVILPLFATDRLPLVPTMMAFVATESPAPPPPPPPPPPPASEKRPATKTRAIATPGAFAAPIEAPFDILPEPGGEGSEGVEGGVEGGVVGGTVGGIVGGLTEALPPAVPQPPAPRAPVHVGGDIQAPALIHRVEPVYSELAMLAHVEGMVILEAVVDGDGRVESVRVLRSAKFLDEAAIAAVKQWRYRPLVLNGVSTPFVLSVTVRFSLEER